MANFSFLSRWFGYKQKSSIIAPALFRYGYQRNSDLLAEQAFEKVAFVHRCIRVKATNATQFPVQAMRRVSGRGQGRVEVLPDTHALAQLIKKPNDQEDWSGIMESTVTHLQARGEAIWELENGAKGDLGLPRPARLWSWPSQWITRVITDERGNYQSFKINARGYQFTLNNENAIFFKFYNPSDPVRGIGPLAAAYQAADTTYAGMLFNEAFFANGGVPSLVIKYDKDSQVEALTETQRKELQAQYQRLVGGIQNMQSMLVLGPGQDVTTIGSELKDISFERLLRYNERQILAAFGLMPIYMGDVDNANRANSTEQRRIAWEETFIPEFEDIRSLMNRRLCPAFGKDCFIRFDYQSVPAMRRDMKVLSDAIVPLVSGPGGTGAFPIITINEVREEMLGKPPVPWGDGPLPQDAGVDADPTRTFVDPELARTLLKGWKSAAINRCAEGARTPLEVFPRGKEAKRAAKKLGVVYDQAWNLANATYVGLAAHWNVDNPADGVAEFFDAEIEAIAKNGVPGQAMPLREAIEQDTIKIVGSAVKKLQLEIARGSNKPVNVSVAAAEKSDPPVVHMNIAPAVVNLAPNIHVDAPKLEVNPVEVNVHVTQEKTQVTKTGKVERQPDGSMEFVVKEDVNVS